MKKTLGVVYVLSFCSIFADVVDKIEFEGLDRVEKEAIQDCITIKPNKNYDQSDIDTTLKALFKKDFFSYVKFIKRGNTLVVKCTEKPMVDKVSFEGNDAASDDVLKNIINGRVGEGRLFSIHTIKDILSDFQMEYKALGYCSVIITPKIIRHNGNRVNIVFEIIEGSKTTVKKILFVGNKNFSDDELKDLLTTKEAKIWRFWDYESHVFREDKVDVDTETLTTFYKNNGFPFFMVTSVSAEMDFDRKSHYCTFAVEEGDKYTIKNVSLKSKVSKIKAKDFEKYVVLPSGSVYNEALITANRDMIRGKVAMEDHPFTDVVVAVDYDKVNKTADIKYSIVEKAKAFIERIEIVGNNRTLDRVIRREFSIHEGDAYNVYKIQRTVECLKSIGYFDDVHVSDSPGSTDDKKVLVVSVKEKESTTQLRFGLNVSDADGFGGFIGFVENNLNGSGQTLSADIFWMQKYYGCKFNIFDPHFMDKNFGAGLSVGAHQYNRKNIDRSVTKSAYLSPYIRYAITERIGHRIGYTISFNDRRWWDRSSSSMLDKVPPNVPVYLTRDEYGRYTCSEISSVLSYDRTDNPYSPRAGYDVSLTNSYAGVGGSVRYFKNEIEGNYYHALTKKLTFIASASVGHIKEIRGTRNGHRFTLGGDGVNMRGFDSYGVGPRDAATGDSVGGNKYWALSFVVKAPLSSREIGVDGKVFVDFGSAWGSKYNKSQIKDSSAIRSSAGIAIEWARSPLGVPLSFVFGFPIKKKSFDEKQTFTLTGFM
ncbi:MAG: outer membrane protein assembly factor BamA [Holosporaceae bacterium]|jgi:outer membrane protein insertion porin family|nr:outer membrane protein assembly factor BamA [Holosporaceae bacterium]